MSTISNTDSSVMSIDTILRVEFLEKLAFALVEFNGPTLHAEAELITAARKLEVEQYCQIKRGHGVLIFTWGAEDHGCIIQARRWYACAPDAVCEARHIYSRVVRDEVSPARGGEQLMEILERPDQEIQWVSVSMLPGVTIEAGTKGTRRRAVTL